MFTHSYIASAVWVWSGKARLVWVWRTQVNELSSVVELHPPVRTTGLELSVPLKTRGSHCWQKNGKKANPGWCETKDDVINARAKLVQNRVDMERKRRVNMCRMNNQSHSWSCWTCKCLTAPHWRNEDKGAANDGAGLCICVWEMGGRGARRQSLGTEPGMPSQQAKQGDGEQSGNGSPLHSSHSNGKMCSALRLSAP